MKKYMTARVWFVSSVLALSVFLFATSASAATITTTLELGSSGANVTSLQQFLAADASLYPEGLVTGYFGSLTQSAVQRFQCRRDIVCSGDASTTGYGRVGPRTLAAINASMGMGGGGSVSIPPVTSSGHDISAPIASPISVSAAANGATLVWTTNEAARGTVVYSASPIPILEASWASGSVTGGFAVKETAFGFNHSLVLSGLKADTTYHYATLSVDAYGNTQFTWPSSFRTAP